MAGAGWLQIAMNAAFFAVLICALVALLVAPRHRRRPRRPKARESLERGAVDPRKHVPPSI
jgi:hypothetical protein